MALVLSDRVKEATTTAGLSDFALGGAVSGFQTFAAGVGVGNTTYYAVSQDTDWEVGLGTLSGDGLTLARTTVYQSSNSDAKVSFASGAKEVFVTYAADKAVFEDASGNVTLPANLSVGGSIGGPLFVDFANGVAVTLAAGRQWYNGTTGSWNLGMGNGNITQQVGEELFVYGKASAAITDSPLQIIYHTGTVGASGVTTFGPTVAGITDGNKIIGIATESLANNAFGRVTSFGLVHGITTDGSAYGETWLDDDVIWYNPVTGNPTKVKPTAPNIKVSIGSVVTAGNGGSGTFEVRIAAGSTLGGTDSNVNITSVADNQIFRYDAALTVWQNETLPTYLPVINRAGSAVNISVANGYLPVTNRAGSTIQITIA